MNIPVLEINGKKIKAMPVKAKMWRKFMEFDEQKNDLKIEDYIDKHCELIAEVFPDVTADDILDNVELDEIAVLYRAVFKYLTELINSKLAKVVKNA